MRNIDSIPVSSFMSVNLKTEMADQSIHAACKIMNKNNIGSVIVVKEYTTEPVGIITEKDHCTHYWVIKAIPSAFTLTGINEQALDHNFTK